MGAVKAVTAAQLAMASDTVYRVSLDQAIEAMRLTAADMSVKYKETSLSVRPPWALALRIVVGPLLLAESSALTGRLFRFPLGFSGKSSGPDFFAGSATILLFCLKFADNGQDTTYCTNLVRSIFLVAPLRVFSSSRTARTDVCLF